VGHFTVAFEGLVVMAGYPGSGKSTTGAALARALGIHLLAKDALKESIWDALDEPRIVGTRPVGKAAIAALLALGREVDAAVLDCFFWPGLAEDDIRALHRPLVQVFCECPLEVCEERFRARDAARHESLRDDHSVEATIDRFRGLPDGPLDLDCPVIRLDTTRPVAIDIVADQVRVILGS
jgi:predicted kinase